MENKRSLIGLGFLYLFLLVGLHIVGLSPPPDPHNLVLTPLPSDTVDPGDGRDLYVMLQYGVNVLDLDDLKTDGVPLRAGQPVYIAFTADGRNHPRAMGVFGEKPSDGRPFLKGTVRGFLGNRMVVHYGVESFAIPDTMWDDYVEFPRPYNVHVRVDDDGHARVAGLVFADRELALSVP